MKRAGPRRSARPLLSVVAPVYNEADGVGELVRRTASACNTTGCRFELVIVNDGSRDLTLQRLLDTGHLVPQLRVIDLLRNFGHMPALSAGLAAAKGDAVVVMDGDLQDPPELIPEFVKAWRAGADVVYGLRTDRRDSLPMRLAASIFYWVLAKVTAVSMPGQAGTFGLMDRRVVDILNQLPERSRYFAGLRAWVGGEQSFVSYQRQRRAHGGSRVGLRGLMRLARAALTSFSRVPLRFASMLSLGCGLFLFVYGSAAIVIRLFTNLAIPGWATTTALIGLMGFVQSFALAMIAEYLGVIFDEVKARPLFLVRAEFVGGKTATDPHEVEPAA